MHEEENIALATKFPGLTVNNSESNPADGICAPSAEAFKNWLQSIKMNGMSLDEYAKKRDEPALTIILECGCEKHFKFLKDVPLKSVKCKHENYFIKIGGEENW